VEEAGNRKGERVQIFRLYFTMEWETKSTFKRQDGNGSSDIGTGLEDRKEEIWERLKEKNMVIWHVGMDSDELWTVMSYGVKTWD